MKNSIYYFSGTGNSLYAARTIGEKLGETALIRITSTLVERPISIDSEMVGVVFPIYFWDASIVVQQFLKQMQIQRAGYLFVVATHGGSPQNTLNDVHERLNAKGHAADSLFYLEMPGNYITHSLIGSNPPSGEPLKKLLADADAALTAIAEKIARRERTPKPPVTFSGAVLSPAVHLLFKHIRRTQDRKFFATDACTHCGMCVKVCPVNNITLTEEQAPTWHGNCEVCEACIHWCPARAIEAGTATQQRSRYHHPRVSASEMTA